MEYNQTPDDLKHKIAIILYRTWSTICPMPKEAIPEAHEKEMNVRSCLLTSCSYVGKFFTETYYVKIEGQETKERDAFQYTLKGFKENGENNSIYYK